MYLFKLGSIAETPQQVGVKWGGNFDLIVFDFKVTLFDLIFLDFQARNFDLIFSTCKSKSFDLI